MLYRTMPKTCGRISILAFGCMRLPLDAGAVSSTRNRRGRRACGTPPPESLASS